MKEQSPAKQNTSALSTTGIAVGALKRKCACGQHTIRGGECDGCSRQRLQRRATSRHAPLEAPPVVHEALRPAGHPTDQRTRPFMESGFSRDFSRVRVHTDSKAAESVTALGARAYTSGEHAAFGRGRYATNSNEGRPLPARDLTHVTQQAGSGTPSLQRKADVDRDGPENPPKEKPSDTPKQEAPKDTPKDAPKDAPKQATGSCGGTSLAATVGASDKRLGGQAVEATVGEGDFGNTSKLAADFRFSACKVGATWRFQLDALVIPVVSKVQPVTFRKNIVSASDAEVTKDSYTDIVRDLNPKRKVTFTSTCSGRSFEDKVTTYSRRETYWNHQFVVDHETFHRKDWVDMYKKELTKAESEVWAHSIPESEATNAAQAVTKANTTLTKFMTDAYQRLCDAYTPQKESRAYDDGAPQYQKLVDQIKERATKEKW